MTTTNTRSIPTGNIKKGDTIRANDAGELKMVYRVEAARVAGYKIAVFQDGSQKALGHKSGFTTIYL